MEPTTFVWLFVAAVAALWAGYERFLSARKMNGEYVADLATAAHEMVQVYQDRVQELEKEVLSLRTSHARLEQMILDYGCNKVECPYRISVPLTKSS